MRKTIFTLIIISVALIGVNHEALSMGNRPPAKKYFVEKYPQSSQASGRVVRVDAGRPAITISTEDYKSLFLIVNSETRILKDGRSIELPEIKKGSFIKVDYEIVYKDKNIAKVIRIEAKPISEFKKKR